MMKPVEQFRAFIVRPTLEFLGLHSPAAEDLVVGTAIHESAGLRYFEQVTGKGDETFGPALGFFQIEPATHEDLYGNFLAFRPELRKRLDSLAAPWPLRDVQLATNIAYACAVCRLIYYRRPEPLPPHGDIDGCARYWKAHYNSNLGKGTPQVWAAHYIDAHRG